MWTQKNISLYIVIDKIVILFLFYLLLFTSNIYSTCMDIIRKKNHKYILKIIK